MHKVLQRLRSSDAGMSLLEVVVAMMIFAIVSLGVLQSLTTVLTVTRDNRARVVATNLASQEIDLARSAEDVFQLFDASYTKTLNGDDFTVVRSTGWVSAGDDTVACSAGGGALRYKRINVEVTWPNMRPGTEPVRFDTLLAPNNRINDPALGTILVSVTGGAGDGIAGVSVSAKPSSPAAGAQTPTKTIANTNVQGCTFILKVVPGNYDVTVSRSGFVTDDGQNSAPNKLASVAAGKAVSISFNYDDAVDYRLDYVAATAPSKVQMPSNLATTMLSSYGPFISPAANSKAEFFRNSVELFPWRSGYEVFAGRYIPQPQDTSSGEKYCLSTNPAAWPDVVQAGVTYSSPPNVVTAAEPGGTANAVVPMGLVPISGLSGSYIRAVSQPAVDGSGDPGCTQGDILTYLKVESGTTHIALPYGTWKIEKLTGSKWGVLGSILSPILGGGSVASETVIVDPRVAS
ncbi:prepilin-type N-terminal cleavage/methylation domain-containing protein [Salinibacterium sp. UTAS2018]|uniref:prepilin-type N-terminal cleavage/methylation domain-containing protein n=1 Tax=Salinibacterium sp. UTAS2018 TaxID=2508880 RepID=UPI001009695C|nr:prepilin-type N-terminal cleavage/methylation domain-containing protein [Salinibacterium sp. UTAS2018]QAV70262.1 prepilin-type N-terminal cleavage/methylation domain-containing protein [Salinibacterium sp. UTAS2018]